MSHAMLSNTALMAALANTPEYKALIVKLQAQAEDTLKNGKFAIESLGGVEMTLPEIAQMYQGLRGIPKSCFPTPEAHKASLAFLVSQECLAIIKKAGFKADWDGIVSLIAHA